MKNLRYLTLATMTLISASCEKQVQKKELGKAPTSKQHTAAAKTSTQLATKTHKDLNLKSAIEGNTKHSTDKHRILKASSSEELANLRYEFIDTIVEELSTDGYKDKSYDEIKTLISPIVEKLYFIQRKEKKFSTSLSIQKVQKTDMRAYAQDLITLLNNNPQVRYILEAQFNRYKLITCEDLTTCIQSWIIGK